MLLTGRHIDAHQAKEFGLIGEVVPEGTAFEKALNVAEQVAENSPVSIKAIMKSLRDLNEQVPEKKALEKNGCHGRGLNVCVLWIVFFFYILNLLIFH